MKTCLVCDKPLRNNQEKYCSFVCQVKGLTKRISVVCPYCQKEFQVPPSRTGRSQNIYCSRQCADAHKTVLQVGRGKKRITLICQQCGKSYEIIPSWSNTSKYCSRECQDAHRRTVRGAQHPLKKNPHIHVCEFCGGEYETKPARANKTRFCSRQCQGSWHVQNSQTTSNIEIIIASLLDELGIRYEQQKPMAKFLCDFYLPDYKLVIECDGTYWHSSEKQKEKDRRKNSWLRSHNINVLRLTEEQIRNRLDECRELIFAYTFANV